MINISEEQSKELLCKCIGISSYIHELAEGADDGFDTLTDQAKREASKCTHIERLILLGELMPLLINQLEVTAERAVKCRREIVEKN
jgi:hypothetical protein